MRYFLTADDSSGTHFPSTIWKPSGHSCELAFGLGCSDDAAGSLLAFSAEDAAAELAASDEAGALDASGSLLDAAGASDDEDGAAFGFAGGGAAGAGAEELDADAGSADELELTMLDAAEEALDGGALEDAADELGAAEAEVEAGSLEEADDGELEEACSLDAPDDAADEGCSLEALDADAWLPSCCAA